MMKDLLELLREQRWDDHRYYHHSTINQSLHLVSAVSFVVAYAVAFHSPAVAALLGWLVSMTSRQAGHFFFEPRGYDEVNHATHEHKEEIKVGYNLHRKIVLMTIWALSPLLVVIDPTLLGLCQRPQNAIGFLRNVGMLWLTVALAGLAFRVGQLFVQQNWRVGVVWATKIVTDPFHDIMLYWRAPLLLMRGIRLDYPVVDGAHEEAEPLLG